MAYLSDVELKKAGFKFIGRNVKISDKASIYNPELIEIGDNSRIDDFCMVSGKVKIGRNVHITPQCLVAGGLPGVEIGNFVALAYGVKVFAQSDDYSGNSMTNSTIPKKFKNEILKTVKIHDHVIIGANSTVMPGVVVGTGCAVGAASLLINSTEDWSIYVGSPANKIKDRAMNIIGLTKQYMKEAEI